MPGAPVVPDPDMDRDGNERITVAWRGMHGQGTGSIGGCGSGLFFLYRRPETEARLFC